MNERKSAENNFELPDYTNEDVVRQMFGYGNPEELKRYQEAYGLTDKQIECFVAFAQMRNKVHDDMAKEMEQRLVANPKPSSAELNIGFYQETLEPQVRDAVFTIRRKGYPTYESGFYYKGATQRIGVKDEAFSQVSISSETMEKLTSSGIQIYLTPKAIELNFDKIVTLDEIENAWNLIAEDLPDLGHEADQSNTPASASFRNKVSGFGSTGK